MARKKRSEPQETGEESYRRWLIEDTDPYVQVAMDVRGIPARLALRYQGTFLGRPLTMVVGVLHGELRSPHTIGRLPPEGDELLLCRLLVKPYQRFIGAPLDMDANGLLVRGGLHPANWSGQVEGPKYREPQDMRDTELITGPLKDTKVSRGS